MRCGANDGGFFDAWRRPNSVAWHLVRGLVITALVLAAAAPALAERQDLDQLRTQVEQFLQSHYAQSGAQRVEVDVARLDPRLQLSE